MLPANGLARLEIDGLGFHAGCVESTPGFFWKTYVKGLGDCVLMIIFHGRVFWFGQFMVDAKRAAWEQAAIVRSPTQFGLGDIDNT